MGFNNKTNKSYSSNNSRNERGSGRGMRQQKQQQKPKQTYINLLTAFANDYGNRIGVNLKPHNNLQEVMTLEEFLVMMTSVYNGEFTMTISLFESNIPQADWTGGFRVTEDELAEIQEATAPAKKKAPAKRKPPAKPVYEVPEDDDEDYEEVEETEEEIEGF